MLVFNIGLQRISVAMSNKCQLFQNPEKHKCGDFITLENPEYGKTDTIDEEILLKNTIGSKKFLA